jgi:exodeoxyribonuclease VII large subunit
LPLAKITLYPALVQGLDAPKDLVRALKEVYSDNKADVIIIGRGGGSYEDLACFNDELLARTLFSSPIPTVSAIGHEADYTICDYIASFRAPTPTGAAMVLTKEKRDVLENIYGLDNRLNIGIKNVIVKNANSYIQIIKSYGISNYSKVFQSYEDSYNRAIEKLEKYSPKNILDNNTITIDNLSGRLEQGYLNKVNYQESSYNRINDKLRGETILDNIANKTFDVCQKEEKINLLFINKLNKLSTQLDNLIDKAIILNPLNLMSKGYSIAYQNEKVIDSVDNIKKDLPFINDKSLGFYSFSIVNLTVAFLKLLVVINTFKVSPAARVISK